MNNSILVDILKKAGNEYHNNGTYLKISEADHQQLQSIVKIPKSLLTLRVMTDQLYDILENWLRQNDPTNPFLKMVGAPIIKQKAKLPIQMSGLEKMTVGDNTVAAFTAKVSGPYIVSDKLDGISIQLEFGDTIKAYTRGDGMIGEDISYLVDRLRIPKSSPYKNIRGEIIMKEKTFTTKWASEYENARNLVAGKVNAKSLHASLKDMDVVIYGVLSDNTETPDVQLIKLENAGFNVAKFQVFDSVDEIQLSDFLKKRKAASLYAIDGVVVVAKRVGLVHTVDDPEWGRKFKENIDFFEVAVTGVEYDVSKDGYLKPTISIEPTRISGVTVSRAAAFNHKFIVESKLGVGSRIIITRSGDVIPHIVEIIAESDNVAEPNEPWVWNETGVDAIVKNPETHPIVNLKRIGFFFATLQIDELGESSFVKVIVAGFDTISKIIKMTLDDWKSVDGFAGKRGDIAFTEMKKCMNNVYLPSLADASGFFGRGFGTTRFEAIFSEYPNLMNEVHNYNQAYADAIKVKSIGITMAEQFATGITNFIPWVNSLKDYITFVEPEKTEHLGNVFENQSITFTGFRNADWQKIVEQQNGNFVDFGSKTTMLVYGAKKSGKVDVAIKKGIKVFTQEQFSILLIDNKLL